MHTNAKTGPHAKTHLTPQTHTIPHIHTHRLTPLGFLTTHTLFGFLILISTGNGTSEHKEVVNQQPQPYKDPLYTRWLFAAHTAA